MKKPFAATAVTTLFAVLTIASSWGLASALPWISKISAGTAVLSVQSLAAPGVPWSRLL